MRFMESRLIHRFHLVPLAAALLVAAAVHAQTKPAAKPQAAASASAQQKPPASPPPGVKQDAAKENAGQAAATGWLGLLDRRDWGSAWEHSSGLFRKNVPLASWMDAIPKVREPLGALVERQPVGVVYKTSLPGHPDGDYVSVFFASKYEKKAEVKETVLTVREPDGKWRVTGYSAQ
jgi:hypothetical protein